MVRAGYKQTEVGVIPEDWEVVNLEHVTFDMLQGINTAIDKPEYTAFGIPMLKATNIIDQYINFDDVDFISEKTYKKYSDRFKIKPNDFLFSNIGARLGTGSLFENGSECTFAWNVMRIIPNLSKINPKYLYSIVNSPKISYNIKSNQSGSGMGFVPKGIMKNVLIPLPSIKEQTAIATALSDIDALITTLTKLIDKKRQIKTATMQQLLTGKQRLAGFGEGKGMKSTELGEIPEDWGVKTYGQIFDFLKNYSYSRSDLLEDGEIGYIHYGDIHTKFHTHLNPKKSSYTYLKTKLVKNPTLVKNGDIVIADASEDYEGIGKSIEIINLTDQILIAGLHTLLLRDKTGTFATIFKGYLATIPSVRAQFERLATGLKVYGLSKNSLKQVYLPVPPFQEQQAIAQVLSDMDDDLNALEARLTKTKAIKQGMMQELLTGRTRLI